MYLAGKSAEFLTKRLFCRFFHFSILWSAAVYPESSKGLLALFTLSLEGPPLFFYSRPSPNSSCRSKDSSP